MTKIIASVARKLSESAIKNLEAKLISKYGKDIQIKYVVNPELVGGIKLMIGTKEIDASVSAKLASLREQLLKAI